MSAKKILCANSLLDRRWVQVVRGLLTIAFGVLAASLPAWAITRGVFDIVCALALRGEIGRRHLLGRSAAHTV